MLRVNRLWSAIGLCAALVLGSAPCTEAGLFDAWGKSCKVTFSGYTGSSTLTNFPALIALGTNISGFSYSDFNSGASDLRFESSTGAELPYEIDTWNSAGMSYVWVKVPTIASATDFVTAYWKNTGATAPTNANATWDANYSFVLHMKESLVNGTSGGLNYDSTPNANNGTQNNTGVYTNGKIGVAQQAATDSQANFIRLPGATLNVGSYTKELWYYNNASGYGAIFNGANGGTPATAMGISIGGLHYASGGNMNEFAVVDPNAMASNEWIHYVGTYDGTTFTLYTNGVSVGSSNDPTATSPTNVYLFNTGDTASNFGWGAKGRGDEARLSTIPRSADWIMATYKTAGANSSFQTYAMNTNGYTTVIASGSSWMYHNDGTLPAANWTDNLYVDSGWSNGAAPLGYADAEVVTTLSYGANPSDKYITYYFRSHFNVSDPSSVTGLVAQYKADDGAVFYLNGTKIHTTASIIEPVDNDSLTTTSATEPYVWTPFTINPALLIPGDNIFAVEVHQNAPDSSDLFFDATLEIVPFATTNQVGGGYTPPTPPENWTAYNDTAWQSGDGWDVSGSSYTTYSPSVTPSGALMTDTGTSLPVTVSITTNAGSGPINWFAVGTNVAPWYTGTDAATEFQGKVGRGYMCELQGTGVIVDVAFSGLNNAKVYKLVVWCSRVGDNTSYSNRYTDVILTGMGSFINNSTVADGVTEFTTSVTDDSTTLRATFRDGYAPVARFEQITTGGDGMIAFRVKRNALSTGNHYINAFKLVESAAGGGGDADVDGMDDTWETTYFGSTTNATGGTNQDFDGDGSSNYDEYIAGTLPNSASSKLEFTSTITNTPGTVVFSWAGVAGKTYTVQGATTITSTWTTLQSGIPGVSPTTVYTGSTASARNFMRVKVQ